MRRLLALVVLVVACGGEAITDDAVTITLGTSAWSPARADAFPGDTIRFATMRPARVKSVTPPDIFDSGPLTSGQHFDWIVPETVARMSVKFQDTIGVVPGAIDVGGR